jgi:F0F1-type ATP synthase delta subunit
MQDVDFSNFFNTKSQASDFLARLSKIAESIYKDNFDLEKSLTEQFDIQKKEKFMVFLRNNNVSVGSISEVSEFFDQLETAITNLPTLSLTLAFEPKQETMKMLSEWFLQNVKKQFLFEISVDPNLIGGVEINFSGKSLDYSIKELFDKIFKETVAKTSPPPFLLKNQHVNKISVG